MFDKKTKTVRITKAIKGTNTIISELPSKEEGNKFFINHNSLQINL